MKILYNTLKAEFKRVLLQYKFTEAKAETCATIFANNSLDGIYTHGLNRFPGFVEYIREGLVIPDAEPVLESNIGLLEQYNGNLGPGILNGLFCIDRAVELAAQHGIGCVAVRNTNHWMRGGTYGWRAADAGYISICFTNTIANLPPWGGIDPRLGNNPLVIAVPRANGHVVLDMAMSQYAYGKLQQFHATGQTLPLPGGYDESGNLSLIPGDIIQSKRMLPVGFWKGSGLTMMLDLLVTILSNGRSTAQITDRGKESGVSQVFIAIKPGDNDLASALTEQIIAYTKTSRTVSEADEITYPGENTLRTRERNMAEGVPVIEKIWNEVLAL